MKGDDATGRPERATSNTSARRASGRPDNFTNYSLIGDVQVNIFPHLKEGIFGGCHPSSSYRLNGGPMPFLHDEL